ncbi:barstar family protein [Nocardiopsis sp. YSL2]|uniref:barstar family protein n=1 Tax=Nocardiopsis sp. YSL2 TaxID=2939492 RepID=UPI0026F43065|nr:barstar family protein [Nocardiopsis sp. YSL2]
MIDLEDEPTEAGIRSALVRGLGLSPAAAEDWRSLEEAVADFCARGGEVHVIGWDEVSRACPTGAAEVMRLSEALTRSTGPAVFTVSDSPVSVDVTVDVGGVADSRELHVVLKRALGFPDMYGRNLDAFWDAITGLVELPRTLRFTGWRHLEEVCPRDARVVRAMLEEYLAEDPRRRGLVFED